MRLHWPLIFKLFVLFLSGCAAVGPDYVPPAEVIPDEFNTALSEDQKAKLTVPKTGKESDATITESTKQVTPVMMAE